MKIKNLFLGAGITLLVASQPFTAIAATMKVGGKDLQVMDNMAIKIMRNEMGVPIVMYPRYSADGKYRFKDVKGMTLEGVSKAPAARMLYRVADIYDRKTKKPMTVLLPIQFVN